MTTALQPAARLRDVVRGRAALIGRRASDGEPRGLCSPVEPRVLLGIPYDDLPAAEDRYLATRTVRSDLALLLRVAVARLLARTSGASAPRRPFMISAHVDNLTIDEALEAIFKGSQRSAGAGPAARRRAAPASDALADAPPAGSGARFVHFVHPHALNLAARDAQLRACLSGAHLVLPDGVGLRVAAAILGFGLRHNLNGTDLLPPLCRRAAAGGVPLALIGAAPGVAQASARRLLRDVPGLSIPVVSHGFLSEAESASVAERVRGLGRCLVLVAMGSPLQERWAHRHLADARAATVLTVGGLFDFTSGRIPRAPRAWRELGCEWLWRLRQEPRRMARRYLLGNPLFLLRALRQRWL